MDNTRVSGRWTLTLMTPGNHENTNIRFASEIAARTYMEEIMAQIEQSDEEPASGHAARPTCIVWFDTSMSGSFPHPARSLRSFVDSAEAYDPRDF